MNELDDDILIDSAGKVIDDIYIYYGKERLSDVSEFDIRNHLYKGRINDRPPKWGNYCMPEEFFSEVVGFHHSVDINKSFRGVQYIIIEDTVYWIYCMSLTGIYNFKFIGINLSISLTRMLLMDHEFILGFKRKRKIGDDGIAVDIDTYSEVWYNKKSLKVIVLMVKGHKVIDRMVYYKKFESDCIISLQSTNKLFMSDIVTIPLIYDYSKLKELEWSSIVNICGHDGSFSSEEPPEALSIEDYNANMLYFAESDYEDMLKIIFNKI